MRRWEDALAILVAAPPSGSIDRRREQDICDLLDHIAAKYRFVESAGMNAQTIHEAIRLRDAERELPTELAAKAREAVGKLAEALIPLSRALYALSGVYGLKVELLAGRAARICTELAEIEEGIDAFTFGADGKFDSSPLLPLVAKLREYQGRSATKPENSAQNFCADRLVGLWHWTTGKLPPVPKNRRGPFVRFADAVTAVMRETDPGIENLTVYCLKAAINYARTQSGGDI